jgi:hypothetical protein
MKDRKSMHQHLLLVLCILNINAELKKEREAFLFKEKGVNKIRQPIQDI